MNINELILTIEKRYNVRFVYKFEKGRLGTYTNAYSLPTNGYYDLDKRVVAIIVNRPYAINKVENLHQKTALQVYVEMHGLEQAIATILHEVGHCIDFDNTRVTPSEIGNRFWNEKDFQLEKERMAWIYGYVLLKDLQLHKHYPKMIEEYFVSVNQSFVSYYTDTEMNGKHEVKKFAEKLQSTL